MENADAAVSTNVDDTARISSAAGTLFDALGSLLQEPELAAGDDFYDVGGDSLTAVRLSGQLRGAGWHLSIGDILDAESLGDMVDRMRPAAVTVRNEPKPMVDGSPFPLAPIQLDALELRSNNPDLFNLSAVFAIPSGVSPEHVDRAVRMVVDAHDMLRVRVRRDNGEWRQMVMPSAQTGATAVEEVSPEDRVGVESIAQAKQCGLSLADGRVCSFTTLVNNSVAWGLMVVVHHIATDAVGWDVLVEDLGSAIRSAQQGGDFLPLGSSPYRSWVAHTCQLAESPAAVKAADEWFGWLSSTGCADQVQPTERPVVLRRETTRKTARHTVTEQAAFKSLSRRYGADVLVLSCLNYALQGSGTWGSGVVDTFSNARHLPLNGHDFSRTIGWFSVKSPIVIDTRRATSPIDFLERTAGASSKLKDFRTLYGALRYHSPDKELRQRIVDWPVADVCLNYRGAALRTESKDERLQELDYSLGATSGPDEAVKYALRVSCDVEATGLVTKWRHPSCSVSDVTSAIHRFDSALKILLGEGERSG